jgi:UDP-glucose 4-epimerase
MRVFVSGIAGFIGSHVADALLAEGHQVWGIDDLSGGDPANVPKSIPWIEGRCQDIQRISNTDVVIHCAALAHEGLSVFSPKLITNSVFGASVSVFSAAIDSGVKRIVNLSSMARYGCGIPPFTEQDKCKPCDPYGIAKVAAEHVLQTLCEIHGVEWVTAVPHSVYGPRQCLTDPYRNVVAIFLNRMAQGKSPIIYGDGEQKRNFSYISDAVPTIVKLVTAPREVVHQQVFNIGPDEQTTSINDLAHRCYLAMLSRGHWSQPAIYVKQRPCEVRDAWCLSDKARQILGYRTETSLDEGIAAMARWVSDVGPKPFEYKLPIEIKNDRTPLTWTEQEI